MRNLGTDKKWIVRTFKMENYSENFWDIISSVRPEASKISWRGIQVATFTQNESSRVCKIAIRSLNFLTVRVNSSFLMLYFLFYVLSVTLTFFMVDHPIKGRSHRISVAINKSVNNNFMMFQSSWHFP